jgi:hypothetical protein
MKVSGQLRAPAALHLQIQSTLPTAWEAGRPVANHHATAVYKGRGDKASHVLAQNSNDGQLHASADLSIY